MELTKTIIPLSMSNFMARFRNCTVSQTKVIAIYDALKYKYAPFKKKKSVVHKSEFRE